jgi:hypothetical protein
MDEYLFILMAKLKADRARLERNAQYPEPATTPEEVPQHRSPRARRTAPPDVDLSAVVSTHGLRGWS